MVVPSPDANVAPRAGVDAAVDREDLVPLAESHLGDAIFFSFRYVT